MNTSTLLCIGATTVSLAEFSYILDLKKYIQDNNSIWDNANRLELIAQAYLITLYPNYFKKEKTKMKKFNMPILSRRTKILYGAAGITLVGATGSLIRDVIVDKEMRSSPDILLCEGQDLCEKLCETAENVADAASEFADTVANEI